jgi:hypothetical protein
MLFMKVAFAVLVILLLKPYECVTLLNALE